MSQIRRDKPINLPPLDYTHYRLWADKAQFTLKIFELFDIVNGASPWRQLWRPSFSAISCITSTANVVLLKNGKLDMTSLVMQLLNSSNLKTISKSATSNTLIRTAQNTLHMSLSPFQLESCSTPRIPYSLLHYLLGKWNRYRPFPCLRTPKSFPHEILGRFSILALHRQGHYTVWRNLAFPNLDIFLEVVILEFLSVYNWCWVPKINNNKPFRFNTVY